MAAGVVSIPGGTGARDHEVGDTPAIVVDGVSKRFRLKRDRPASLKEAVVARRRRRRLGSEEFWALRDVSLEIPRGATFGIIGHNGSGKSTLLRLIAGIHRPTEGRVRSDGRISALLELGAGFHPDLTGRENIYLNGSILGLTRPEISAVIDDIIEFSGIEDFIDAPVKVYSSGMYVRLGFAIAVHVNPEILLIDEVMAVGDEDFQRRCFDHLYELRRQGVTIVLVSHSLSIVQTMCDQAAWLDHGDLVALGPPAEVVGRYIDRVNDAAAVEPEAGDGLSGSRRTGSGEIKVHAVELLDSEGRATSLASTGDPVTVRVAYHTSEAVDNPVFGVIIYHETGLQLAAQNTSLEGLRTGTVEGEGHFEYSVERLALMPGTYRLTTSIYDSHLMHPLDVLEDALTFRVQEGSSRQRFGLVALAGRFSRDAVDLAPSDDELRGPR